LDSSNIETDGKPSAPRPCAHSETSHTDWIRIATEIELNYAVFDAFVVLHGTDTMAYTSSALSFLLEDLGKTVVSLAVPALSSHLLTWKGHHRGTDPALAAPERRC
jgi:hypothetical protein